MEVKYSMVLLLIRKTTFNLVGIYWNYFNKTEYFHLSIYFANT